MNYFDILLAKKLEDDRDPKVEGLSVTENGRYHEDGVVYDPVIVEVPEPTLISKSITANGNYSASADNADGYSSVNVDVPLPSNAYLLKSIENEQIATFTDGTDNFLKSLEVAIEPQQDLHGYDNPWVAGAGKNKLPMSVSAIKSYNTSGTWTGDVYVVNGVTFTILSDGNDNVLGIKVNGTTTTESAVGVDVYRASGITPNSYIINGCPEGGGGGITAYYIKATSGSTNVYDTGEGKNITLSSSNLVVTIFVGSANNKTFYPMLRLSTESDATFAPYSNICPISGWDECKVTVADDLENPTVSNVYTIDLDGTRYGGKLDVVNGVLTLTDGFISSYNGETLPSTWISDRDVYAEGTTPTIGAEVCYELATPITIQLTPTIIKSLQGDNNFFADSGEVIKLQYWGKEQN
jgi:hypothetical protein